MEISKESKDQITRGELEDKLNLLQKQKEQLEHEFGLKRAKFKSMYLECESSLNAEKEKRKTAEALVDKLQNEIADLKSDTEGIQTAAKFSEEARQEEITALKIKHHEEMVSMEHIWREAIKDARSTTAKQFEEEYKRLSSANQKLEQQIKGAKAEDKSEGIISLVSQVMRRTSVTPQGQSTSQSDKKDASQADKKDDTLSDSLTQAQENVEAWRSIVVPLEQEISTLKSKLKEARTKIKHYEAKASKSNSDSVSLSGVSSEKLQDQIKELQGYLDAERSSRTDLEMFVAVLNTQKGVLQEDADKLRQELHNVCRLLEQEKTEHRELKETWRKANEEFLEQQMMLTWEIEKMRQLLTPVQIEKLSKEFRQKQSRPAKTIKTVAEEPYTLGKSNDNLISFEDSPSKTTEKPLRAITPSDVQIIDRPLLSKSSSAESTDDSNDDHESPSKDSLHPVGSLEEGEELIEDVDEHDNMRSIGLRKSVSSSDVNEHGIPVPSPGSKSLSQGDVSSIISASGEDAWAVISSPTVAELERKMHLNETGWSTMKESSATSQTCMMCQNYEKQLQRLQKEFVLLKDRKDSLMAFAKREKMDLRAEREKVEKLEKSVCIASEDAQKQIRIQTEAQDYQANHLEELQKEFLALQEDVFYQVRQLSEERDRTLAELETLREENANLRTIQETLRQDRPIDMSTRETPDVSRLYEQLERMKVDASNREEELRSQIMFLKDRVMAEQFQKENTEEILQQDIDLARQEIARLKEKISLGDTSEQKDSKDEDAEPTESK